MMKNTKRECLFAIGLALAVSSVPSLAAVESVNGTEWTYGIVDGFAALGGGGEGATAVPSSASGALAAPAVLGGRRVREISDWAFGRCGGLSSVVLPEGTEIVGANAFASCSALESVSLPDTLRRIGDHAFCGCVRLGSVAIPGGVTEVEPATFDGCSGLESVALPNGVTAIGEWAFRNCGSLASLEVPDGVTDIAANAFQGCTALATLSLPAQFRGATGEWNLPESCEVSFREPLRTVVSRPFFIDLRPDPRPASPVRIEWLAYDARWADPDLTAAAMELTVDGTGAAVFSDASGDCGWTPDHGGLVVLALDSRDGNGDPIGAPLTASFLAPDEEVGKWATDGISVEAGGSSVALSHGKDAEKAYHTYFTSTNLSDRIWTAAEDSRATANLGPAGQPVLDELDGWDGPVRFFRLVTTRYLRFRRGDEREF